MALEERIGVRELALKLYTDVLSGLVMDRATAWCTLVNLVDTVGRQPETVEECDGIYSILADLCCELCFEELSQTCSEEFLSCISRSHVAVRIGLCVSITQRLGDLAADKQIAAVPAPILQCLQRVLASLPSVADLVLLLSHDKNVCHGLEVFYREAYDLTAGHYADFISTVLGMSNINPGVLLVHSEVVKLSSHPEITGELLLSAGAILPYCATNEALTVDVLVADYLSFDWKSTQDDTADVELVAAWVALGIQLIVRSINAGAVCTNWSDLFVFSVIALVINRLGMTAKLMTEPVDVGLLALSDTHTTDLTAITSGIETLVCLAAEQFVVELGRYFTPQSAEVTQPLQAMVRRIVEASGIIDSSLEEPVSDWLATDALCFIAANLRWYNAELESELSEGLLKSFFEAQLSGVGRQIAVDVPCTENWIRAFLLSTLLRLLSSGLSAEELLDLSKLLVSPAWWCPDSRQKRLQAAYVCCHLVEQLVDQRDVIVVVNGAGVPLGEKEEASISRYHLYAKRLTEDESSLLGMLSIIWTLYDETSEVAVKEWCVSAYRALESLSTSAASNRILARFDSFLDPRSATTVEF